MRHGTGRRRKDDERNDEGHGAEVKEPLDDVDAKLGAERNAGFARDEVGAHRIGDAADERHRGKAHNLRAEKRKGADLLVVTL